MRQEFFFPRVYYSLGLFRVKGSPIPWGLVLILLRFLLNSWRLLKQAFFLIPDRRERAKSLVRGFLKLGNKGKNSQISIFSNSPIFLAKFGVPIKFWPTPGLNPKAPIIFWPPFLKVFSKTFSFKLFGFKNFPLLGREGPLPPINFGGCFPPPSFFVNQGRGGNLCFPSFFKNRRGKFSP